MSDQKTLIEDLICFGSRYDLESCSLAAKVIAEQENLIRKLQSENESGRATISQLKERVALLESSRAKEAETASAMIGLEKLARDELERFKKDWSVLRSESGVFERENKELRDEVKRLEQERDEALALLNEKDAALQAARENPNDFARSVERGGHIVTERCLRQVLKERDAARADLERVQAEAAAMREALQMGMPYLLGCYDDGVDIQALSKAALSGQAGAALLAELARLREVERLAKAYRSAVTERRAHKMVDSNTDDSPLGTKWSRRLEELTMAKRAAGEELFNAVGKEAAE